MRNEKIGFLAIILVGLLLLPSCIVVSSITREIKFQQEFNRLGIDFGNKESILRLEQDPNLFQFWTEWEPIKYLVTKEEKKIVKKILKIEDEAGRNAKITKFIAWFWERRDDNSYDEINEFKENFYDRVVESQTRFANKEDAEYFRKCARGKGWQTDMGLIYILLGKQDCREHYTINDLISFQGGYYQESALGPQKVEIWYYYNVPEEYDGFEFQSGVAYIIFEKNYVWEFVNEWAYGLTQGYTHYYDSYGFRGLSYNSYQTEVYTKFLQAVAESYVYDWDLKFKDKN